jgi:hypothetical protein
MITKHTFRQWLVGLYAEYAYDNKFEAMIEEKNAKKAQRFSFEVLDFLEQHDLLK